MLLLLLWTNIALAQELSAAAHVAMVIPENQ
jgi:hypothetical protein